MSAGSGKFVQMHEWTCPDHNSPWRHECDCSACDREWDCETCATAKWRDLFNEDGSPKMREVGLFEAMLMTQVAAMAEEWNRPSILLSELGKSDKPPIIEWGDV